MTFKPGQLWLDDRGLPINAHGGGILRDGTSYYWFGEHKGPGWDGRLAQDGVHVYRSENLYHWKDEGLALTVVDDPASPIGRGCRIERPKVLRCPATGQYVMWFHSSDENHRFARSGVAVADRAVGPYRFLQASRAVAGRWPMNARMAHQDPESIRKAQAEGDAFPNGENTKTPSFNILGRDFAAGQMARDMTLFQDDDGRAYHVYASEHNSTLHIAELSEDYLTHRGRYARVFEHRWMEAPALFKHEGRYYLLMSGCTSWDPNPARAAVADHIFGPWIELGNPCRGPGADLTFGGQSTFVLSGATTIALFDRWNAKDFVDSRYVWLPVTFTANGYEIAWRDEWRLDEK